MPKSASSSIACYRSRAVTPGLTRGDGKLALLRRMKEAAEKVGDNAQT